MTRAHWCCESNSQATWWDTNARAQAHFTAQESNEDRSDSTDRDDSDDSNWGDYVYDRRTVRTRQHHTDACVVSEGTALIIHDYGKVVSVSGYREDVGEANNCRIVSAVVAYDDPSTGAAWMLVFHQAILVPGLKANLLCPNQMRENDLRVNDEPKYTVLNPTDDHHAIVVPSDDGSEEALRIPLSMIGVTSYFPTRKPTEEEWEDASPDSVLDMTPEEPEWDPSSKKFQEQEESMTDSQGKLKDDAPRDWTAQRVVAALHTHPQETIPSDWLGAALQRRAGVQLSNESGSARGDRGRLSVSAIRTGKKKLPMKAQELSRKWGIGVDAAQRTLDATLQRGVRTVLHPTLSRRFRTNDRQLRYRRLSHDMFTDTLKSRVVSWRRKNRYAQVFATRFGWVRVFPMQAKSEAHEGLSLLAQRDGVPPRFIMDGSKEQTLGQFRKKIRQMGSEIRQTEPDSPWQNAAESAIREVKRGAGRKQSKMRSPKVLWDHCLELEGYIRSHTALKSYELQGEVPETIVSGQTADISPFVEHGWYEWVKFWDNHAAFPDPREVYGRWLGPSVGVGPAMTSKILKENGQVVHLSTYRAISDDEMADPEEKKARDHFDSEVQKRLGSPLTDSEMEEIGIMTPEYQLYADDVVPDATPVPDIDDVTPEDFDGYVGAEVNLPLGGEQRHGKVVRRARDLADQPVGKANSNPILDTRVYQVEFPDGQVGEYSANVIAENMFSQIDENGHQIRMMESIVDHKFEDNAVRREDMYVVHNGKKSLRKTTVGVKHCVLWKDGSTSWERLADLKESYPVEVAEYAVAHNIDEEPAYAWWVRHVLKKRDRIISAVNKRYHKRSHKFGFEVPKTVKRALEIDKENGNNFWRDAIAKEMQAVRVAFKILDGDQSAPPTYQYMECHMIFDIKLDGFKRKARLVAGGHMTETPAVMTYASVVSRETVRIALTLAALNDLEVKASDVQNAYLTAPCEEKIWTILGPEFSEDSGKKAIITRALYGLKSAGGSFTRHIADCMRTLGYEPCKADPDLWMKPMVRPDDGFKYYAYILLYVDDCLAISHNATAALQEIDHYFKMKEGSIGDPDIYLGSKLRLVTLENGVQAWSLSPSKYVQESVRNVREYVRKNFGGRSLPKRASGPWPRDYAAEMDTTPELGHDLANYYQSQVGVLHWIVELGRVDIVTEVSTLASHMALPREGHLEAVFHVFAYLGNKHNARAVLDPSYPDIDTSVFPEFEWVRFYGDVKEPIPMDAPEERGKEVDLRLYVDSDHAGNKRVRRSRTGFFVFMNSALINWLSKLQATIETSVFGAEFVSMKQGIETVRGIRYKLRMMGVPLSGPTYTYGDNMSVIHNTQRPDSTLKKKSNQICYHFARESVAMGETLTTHIDSKENPADLATKIIYGGALREHLVSKVLHDIFD